MYYSIKMIKEANAEAGQCFFEKETIAFFRSVVGQTVYQGPGGVFFTTSEKPPHGPRRHTVRQFHPSTGVVDTVGDFCKSTADAARTLAAECANRGAVAATEAAPAAA